MQDFTYYLFITANIPSKVFLKSRKTKCLTPMFSGCHFAFYLEYLLNAWRCSHRYPDMCRRREGEGKERN